MKSFICFFVAFLGISISFVSAQYRVQNHETLQLYDQEAQPLNLAELRAAIPYPNALSQAGIEGLVQVMVKVDAYGNYQEHYIARTSHQLLSRAVEPYISCLSFTPAMRKGRPIEGWKAIPLRFSNSPFSSGGKNAYCDLSQGNKGTKISYCKNPIKGIRK